MELRNPAFPNGVPNSAKNAKSKPIPNRGANGTGYDERESSPLRGVRRDEKGKSLLKKAAAFFAKELD